VTKLPLLSATGKHGLEQLIPCGASKGFALATVFPTDITVNGGRQTGKACCGATAVPVKTDHFLPTNKIAVEEQLS
jgi:hypothetical protein